jgi:hypothetical protein
MSKVWKQMVWMVGIFGFTFALAQSGASTTSYSQLVSRFAQVRSVSLDALDYGKLAAEDLINDSKSGSMRFAVGRDVNVTPQNNGAFELWIQTYQLARGRPTTYYHGRRENGAGPLHAKRRSSARPALDCCVAR